jgi:hypothetical protein
VFTNTLEEGYQEKVKPEVNLQSSYLGCGNINVGVSGCRAVLETDLSGLLSIAASLLSFKITAGLDVGILGHAPLDFCQDTQLNYLQLLSSRHHFCKQVCRNTMGDQAEEHRANNYQCH